MKIRLFLGPIMLLATVGCMEVQTALNPRPAGQAGPNYGPVAVADTNHNTVAEGAEDGTTETVDADGVGDTTDDNATGEGQAEEPGSDGEAVQTENPDSGTDVSEATDTLTDPGDNALDDAADNAPDPGAIDDVHDDEVPDETPDTSEASEGFPELPAELTTVESDTGLKYTVIEPGFGAEAQVGDAIEADYTGWLEDGTKFDSSVDRGVPFEFTLGSGQVIAGWDEGFNGMIEGEQRRLIIPAELAYGDRGSPPTIPPGATLIFDVELIRVNP